MSSDWWRGAVIYQVYLRSFADGNGDGIGDLPGLMERLEHIAQVGADAIWLCPFFVSPQRDFGYDVANYTAVDPIFGTLEDFDRLVDRAHTLNLKVIIDQVWSHTSNQHPWFIDSRRSRDAECTDWYIWADPSADGTPPTNWLSAFGGAAWSWEPRWRQYYLHHFLSHQPQLNLRNPQLVKVLLSSGEFWLKRGVDGFRLDAIDWLMHDTRMLNNPPAPPADGVIPVKPFSLQQHLYDILHPDAMGFLAQIRALTDRYPGTALVGEVSSQEGAYDRIAHYTAGERHLHMAYTLRVTRGRFDRPSILRLVDDVAQRQDDGWFCWSFSNHDVDRPASRWNPVSGDDPDPAFCRLMMAFLLSLRGSVSMYQGEELSLPEAKLRFEDLRDPFGISYWPEFKGRDGSRTPMPWEAQSPSAGFSSGTPWLPVDPRHFELSVDRQEQDQASSLNAWRAFLTWRRSHPALRIGSIRPVEAPDPLVAFVRECAEEALLVAFNLSDRPVIWDLGLARLIADMPEFGNPARLHNGRVILAAYGTLFANFDDCAAAVPLNVAA